MEWILGVVGLVILLSALLSRAVERGPFSSVILFVAIGLGLGQLGILRLPLDAEPIVLIGMVTLTLTLFASAINMQTEQLKEHWGVSLTVLGPGTLLTALAIAVAARWLLGLDVIGALLLGAVLCSTDPVLLRDVLRDARTPQPVRQILSVESGLNDAVAVPAVLLLVALAGGRLTSSMTVVGFAVPVFVLSPIVGVGVAWAALRAMAYAERVVGVRRDYQSLYSLGVAFAAFAAAQALGGSGLLAAFVAGLTIAISDLDLCECFLEYGETTAELFMLLTFVLFGSTLVRPALEALDGRSLAFAALVLFVCRPAVLLLLLGRFRIPFRDKLFAAWHGPRGLGSILLALLAVLAGAPGAGEVFAITGVVVLASAILHGVLGTPMVVWASRAPEAELVPDPRHAGVPRIAAEELARMIERGEAVLVVDVRQPGALARDPRRIPAAVHYPPGEAAARIAASPPPPGPVVLYCA